MLLLQKAPNLLLQKNKQKKTTTQPTLSGSFLHRNTDHYTKLYQLFYFVLFLLEEGLAFIKLKPIVKLQKAKGLPIKSANKINDKACVELADIIFDVVKDKVSYFVNQSRFSTISGDASEARKTTEEKELVFLFYLLHLY